MTQPTDQGTDPVAVHQIAEEIIRDQIAATEHLTIAERLGDYEDLSEADQDRLADEIHALIDNADITITFPEPKPAGQAGEPAE